MPSYYYTKRGHKRRVVFKKKKSTRAKVNKRALNVFPKSIMSSKGRSLIRVNNRTPKTMDVLLSYKQMIRITQNDPNIPQYPLAWGS